MRRNVVLILTTLAFCLSACGNSSETAIDITATSALVFSTPTLAATFTPQPTNTPLPPSPTPTFATVSASLTAQINLRAAPNIGSEALGMLNFGTEVTIIGRSTDSEWLALGNPLPNVSVGWISVKFVSLSEDLIAGLRDVEATITNLPSNVGETVVATSAPNTATTKAELNVRSGPGSTYEQLGTIPANTVVNLNGRNQTEVWTRVDFPTSPSGFGWVASIYLEGGNYALLPYFDDLGNLIGGQSAPAAGANPVAGAAPTATTTNGFSAAATDNDSFDAPITSVNFGPLDDKDLEVKNSVSSPSGDREDWIRITPFQTEGSQATLTAALTCVGNGAVTVQIFRQSTGQWENIPFTCGVYDYIIKASGGSALTFHITADGSAGDVRLVEYTLTVRAE